MPHVDPNGARLWVEEEGSGPAVVFSHGGLGDVDPPDQKEIGFRVARTVPGARLTEIDSDHYLTLREPEQVNELLLEFLTAAAPPQQD